MIVKKFRYLKEGSEPKDYELLVLNRDELHENGIALNYLNEEEKNKLFEIIKNYEETLKPFMKSFRSFMKSNMTPLVE